jgi:uncharacterized protein YlzI (FlbEa/FlbD family)
VKRRIELHDKSGNIFYLNPDHVVLIAAAGNQPGSPVDITLVSGRELRPRETLQEVLDKIDAIHVDQRGAF